LTKELAHPEEAQITDKFLKEFLKDGESIRVKDWGGWSYRTGRNSRQQTRFWREFDIAVFSRTTLSGGGGYELTLKGYEVKGWRKDRKGKMIAPPFGEGLDQALVLLQQGANFAYLIHPQPKRDEDKSALKELCDMYAPCVGIIYVYDDLSWFETYRKAEQNHHVQVNRTRDLLTSLITGGNFSEISELPLWAKQQQY